MLPFNKSMFIYLQSGFPLIAVETTEIDRAAAAIEQIVTDFNAWLPSATKVDAYLLNNGLEVYRWNAYTGFECGGKVVDGTVTVSDAFEYILSPTSKPAVYLMDDFHLQFADRLRLPMYISQIRKIFSLGKQVNKHLIFISPIPELPIEIRDLVVIIEFKLPSKQELIDFIKNETEEKGCSIKLKEIEQAAEAASSMTINETENAVSVALALSSGKAVSKDIIFNEKIQAVKRSGLLEIVKTDYGLEAVGGLQHLKDEIMEVGKAFTERKKAEQYGLPMPKGCLVIGASGCGKSLIAKVIAKEFKIPLFRLDVGRLFGGIVGKSESNTREVFKLIEALAPCVVLFDEIEKMFAGLHSSGDSGVASRMIGNFLYFMQEKTVPAYFVATANNIDVLPPELLRAGRWDAVWFVDLPSLSERSEIFRIHIEQTKRKSHAYAPLDELAAISEHFTGAEIENAIKIAMFKAFYKSVEYTKEHIISAIKETVPLYNLKKEEIVALRTWAKDRAKRANADVEIIKPVKKTKRNILLNKK